MGLEEYSRKRDFGKTPEPEGNKKAEAKSRFVVQKHQASHLHYDFRLKLGGVLRSWAVPKGLPAESGVRRLAVRTEDHPVEYLDFEGTIPKGEYGAGTVEIWDRGTFELDKEASDRLEFTLHGERFSGGYALIHTGKNNWLLLKRKQNP